MTKGTSYRLILIFIIVIAFIVITLPTLFAGNEPLIFSTWEGFEPDKCASIWLIKRFINKDAVIKFFPKGSIISEGIPFDTPDAKFRRYHNMSTYESLMIHYNLKDSKIIYIGKIIHDIEVNIWDRKAFDETQIVKDEINKIIMEYRTNEDIIQQSFIFFNRIYKE